MYIELTFFGRDLVKNFGFKNYIYSSCHYCQGVGTEVALTQHPPITVPHCRPRDTVLQLCSY